MVTEVVMPKLGLTMQSGTVTKWHKREGDPVKQGEPLLDIESEKITTTVEAPADGVLRLITVREGEECPPATPVGYVGPLDEPLPEAASRPAVAAATAAPSAAAAPARAERAAEPTEAGEYAVSPAARKLARELGVDLSKVRPSGRSRRITTEDVEAYHAALQAGAGAEAEAGRPVAFYSDGIKLAGVLYLPPDLTTGERRPALVLCAGIQGLKELGPRDLAERLMEAGFVALTFDYRGFGQSEGPRWQPWPHEQVRDARAAVTFLAQQPQVDPERIAVLGISMGGGHAISAAAVDPRIKSVVAIEPVTDGRRWLRSLRREWEWRAFQERLAQDRAARVTSGESQRLSLYEIMVPDPDTRMILDVLARMRPELELEPQLPLAFAEALAEYRPEAVVDQIAPRGILFIHGDLDLLVSPDESRQAAARAGEPKRLVVLPNMGHLNWQKPGHPIFAHIVELATGWLHEQLR